MRYVPPLIAMLCGAAVLPGPSARARPSGPEEAATPAAPTQAEAPRAGRPAARPDAMAAAAFTPAAEAAVDKALGFLARSQLQDGSWQSKYPTAMTALSLIAFMGKGQFPGERPYGDAMARALGYLLREARAGSGYMGTNMYAHGLATLALSELWGQTDRDEEIRKALKAAVEVIVRSQNIAGGWRYDPRPADADLSVTAMQVVALSSAKQAGILVSDRTIDQAAKYITMCRDADSGGFGYQPYWQAGFARTAAGTFALMMCGRHDSEAVRGGIAYLLSLDSQTFLRSQYYYYGHYYAVQALYQAGDEEFGRWYPRIRDALIAKQSADGSWKGAGGGAGGVAGPAYPTAMAAIVLAAPYRFIPIYQR